MNYQEQFGNHIRELKNYEIVKIDWPESPWHGCEAVLIGIGNVITRRGDHTIGDSDRVVILDGQMMMFHKEKLV